MTRASVSILGCLLLVSACSERAQETPPVQFSTGGVAAATVQVSEEGRFQPACVTIDAGETVHFVNHSPLPNVNVTGLGHDELFSPNLAGKYRTWSHRFDRSGRFEYFDSNSGNPGRAVVDDYYGTVTYIGTGEGVERGVVCVERPGSARRTGAACTADADCAEDERCGDARECETMPLCANFCCPFGVECGAGYECNPDNQQCVQASTFCVRDGDCADGRVCGPRGECVVECVGDDDCRYGSACVDQRCVLASDVTQGTSN